MRKLLIILAAILALVTPYVSWAACTGSSPTWNTTPDYASVNTCVGNASAGDTVNVSAGSATWSTKLTITKGINLIGAGIGNTTITNGGVDYLIKYYPSSFSLNTPFRVSGFTFDLNSAGGGIAIGAAGAPTPPYTVQTEIRIDNNKFEDTTSTAHQAIWVYGGMYGVIDHNQFSGVHYPTRTPTQKGGASYWDSWETTGFAYNFGDKYVMYFEDNTFTNVTFGVLTDCAYSGRYTFRYNDIQPTTASWPLFDMHGNQCASSMWSCFGGEIYGNRINSSYSLRMVDQRGGKMLIFNNSRNGTGTIGIQIRNEWSDDLCPTTNPQPQYVSSSYYWNNRVGVDGTMYDGTITTSGTWVNGLVEDVNFWNYNAACTSSSCSSGVGAGSATPTGTCTTGVGYWKTSQSISDLTGQIGPDPSEFIDGTSPGTLYKCTSTNVWEVYYTPYTYPHPLTGGIAEPTGTAVVEGGFNEPGIVAGNGTVIITLTDAVFNTDVCAADNAATTAFLAGFDSDKAEATGWDAVVKADLVWTDCYQEEFTANVRTLTLRPRPTYDITVAENVTVTLASTTVVPAAQIVGSPTITISATSPEDPPSASLRIARYYASGNVLTYSASGSVMRYIAGELEEGGYGADLFDAFKGVFTIASLLGANVIVNGDFASWTTDNPDSWTQSGEAGSDPMITEVSGAARLYSSASYIDIHQHTLTENKGYYYTLDIDAAVSGSMYIINGGYGFVSHSSIGAKSGYFFSNWGAGDKTEVGFKRSTTPLDITFDDFVVKPTNLSWAPQGGNQIDYTNNELKITYVDNAGGAKLIISDATDFGADLTPGKTARLQFNGKRDTGDVTVSLCRKDASCDTATIVNTTYDAYELTIVVDDADECYITAGGMGAGEILYLDAMVLQEQ